MSKPKKDLWVWVAGVGQYGPPRIVLGDFGGDYDVITLVYRSGDYHLGRYRPYHTGLSHTLCGLWSVHLTVSGGIIHPVTKTSLDEGGQPYLGSKKLCLTCALEARKLSCDVRIPEEKELPFHKTDDGKFVKNTVESEGFHYAFAGYSNFYDVKDKKFHRLRKAYLKATAQLEEYIQVEHEE